MIAYTWCLAHPVWSLLLVGLFGSAFNGVARFMSSVGWATWARAHPRTAGALLIMKGAFPEGGTVVRGALALFTAVLREKAGLPPVLLAPLPPSIPAPLPPVIITPADPAKDTK